MEQYISKSALIAEINRLKKKNDTYNKPSHIADVCYKEILSFLDTLEAKDFELTVEDIIIILDAENNILHECNDNNQLVIETYPKGEDYYGEILKRFKAQKGE